MSSSPALSSRDETDDVPYRESLPRAVAYVCLAAPAPAKFYTGRSIGAVLIFVAVAAVGADKAGLGTRARRSGVSLDRSSRDPRVLREREVVYLVNESAFPGVRIAARP